MDASILQDIVTQGGVAGVAMLSLWMLNKVWADALMREAANAAQIKQDRDRLADLMERNVAGLTEMRTLLTALSAKLEH